LLVAACGSSNRAPCRGVGKGATGCNAAAHGGLSREVSSLLHGIPQDGDALGSAGAPVTLQYFGDLECPICRRFTVGALTPIINRWVRRGKLRIEYRSLETASPDAETF